MARVPLTTTLSSTVTKVLDDHLYYGYQSKAEFIERAIESLVATLHVTKVRYARVKVPFAAERRTRGPNRSATKSNEQPAAVQESPEETPDER